MAVEHLEIFYWCQETDQLPFETGVQRVTRRLAEKLSERRVRVVPIGWDDRTRRVVRLQVPAGLDRFSLEASPGAHAVLVVPEIPFALAAENLDPIQLGRAYGLRTAALVHDLIPIKFAADYTPEMVAVFRRYVRQFATADIVFATTSYVAADLRAYLQSERLRIPPIEIVPLPAEFPMTERVLTLPPPRGPEDLLKLVTVTTWEQRKNILRLLRAVEAVSNASDIQLSLDLVGRRGGTPYDTAVLELAQNLTTVKIRGTLSDAELATLYASCHASVYPSTEEGFGMPIGESLWLGRPCLCHNGSSMAEIAPGGGSVLVDMMDEQAIADVLRRWAMDPGEITRLAGEAFARPLRDWSSFAADVLHRLTR